MESPSLDIAQSVRILTKVLRCIIQQEGQCLRIDEDRADGKLCECAFCEAVAGLQMTKDWRYLGANAERISDHKAAYHPREVKMIAGWREVADSDRFLAMILREHDGEVSGHYTPPSARDWFVATSVVQWLATNVGMTVLERAGFKYQHFDEDTSAHYKRLEEKAGK